MRSRRPRVGYRRYRMNPRSASPRTLAGLLPLEFLDDDVDDSRRIVLTDIVIKAFGQQRHLLSVFAFDDRFMGHLAQTGWRGAHTNIAVWPFDAEDKARSRVAEHACSSSGLLLARRSIDAAPLPWLQGGQTHPIEGSWLLAMELPDEAAAAAVPGSSALLYRALQ